jgi:ABC-type multidrug transport system ATPase subunit/pSer/pThr/pTyr-binding forkhead associated (FHA) protein
VDWSPQASVAVGRDPAGDVVVDGPRVSRRHVLVEAVPGGWVIRDAASRNGTFLNGERITVIQVAGDLTLALGSATEGSPLQIALAAPVVPPAAAAPATVAPPEAPRPVAQPPAPPEAAPAPPAGPTPQSSATVRPDGGTRPGVVPGRAEEPKSELGRLQEVHRPSVARFRIGRAADNDLALENDPRASRYHAEMRRDGGKAEIVDLNSHNGTFVNGRRINRVTITDGDVVAIGNHVFRFQHGTLEEFVQTDEANLDVAAVSVVIDGSTLLDSVSFSVESRSMLAVVGPSGAGKTTLLRALTGFSRPTHGAIRFGGRDLYTDYDELRSRIGYVPQEDLVHEQLTVRQELEFASALRLPPDLGHAGFAKRADEVMAELGLTARADLSIEKLSGGQRKRVSVGVELLTQPALLYLDEPTSGLDPGNERQVMQVLRILADGGRIVVVVTHSTQSIDVADRVLFLATGGHMAYYGPPREALKYFERQGVSGGWPAVFQALEGPGGAAWGERFRHDADFGRYVGNIAEAPAPLPRPAGMPAAPSRKLAGPVDAKRQTVILCRRQLRLIAGDRKSVILLAAQAPIFGLILTLLFPAHTISANRGPFAAMILWLLIVSSTWLGASNTVREIVKEQSIYRRERAAGLSMLSYTGSKVIVFGVITIVQSLIVLLIVLVRQPLPPGDPLKMMPILQQNGVLNGLRPFTEGSVISSQPVEIFIAMALAGLVGMALGLLVSAAVRKSDQAVFMLPVILIVQMALSQPILQLSNPSPVLKVLGDVTSANWGVNAVASTTSLNQLMTEYQLALAEGQDRIKSLFGIGTPPRIAQSQLQASLVGDPAWAHKSGTWGLAIFILIVMIAVFLVGVLLMMRRLDTGNRRTLLEDVQGFMGNAQARQRQAAGARAARPAVGGYGIPGAAQGGYPPAQPGAPYQQGPGPQPPPQYPQGRPPGAPPPRGA